MRMKRCSGLRGPLSGTPSKAFDRIFFSANRQLHSDFQRFRSYRVGFSCSFGRIRVFMLAQEIVQQLFCGLFGNSVSFLNPFPQGFAGYLLQ